MRFDIYADLDHLYMLNFSVDAARLAKLVPPPLRVLRKRGRGLVSIVLPRVERMRPALTRFPRIDYELCGLRILVEYGSHNTGITKGIYFAWLVIDPEWVRRVANLMTPFPCEAGRIDKRRSALDPAHAGAVPTRLVEGDSLAHRCEITVRQRDATLLRADVWVAPDVALRLPAGSVFADDRDALATYNDISYGFIPSPSGVEVEVLQIAAAHPEYVAWPLVSMAVQEAWARPLHEAALFEGTRIVSEPSYFVGRLPRYFRWLQTERLAEPVRADVRVTGDEPVQ